MSLAGVLGLTGAPRDLLYKPENSLVTQSKHSLMGATTTNGDGFGVGWYGAFETPGLFRSTEPAWNDVNLRELCAHAQAGRVFAHIRQPPEVEAAVIEINDQARDRSLQVALLIPVLAALLGLGNSFRMLKLPDVKPSAAVAGTDFG